MIFTKTSSRCQRHCGKARRAADRFFPISAANIGPNRFHQNRTLRSSALGAMADIDPPFMKRVLNVPPRKRKSDMHHHREADNLGRAIDKRNGLRGAGG